MLEHAQCRHITYGIDNPATLQAADIQVLADGAQFNIKIGDSVLPLKLHITGIFNVYNVMAAIGAAMAEGVPAPVIKKCMEEFTSVPGRF